MAPKRRTTRLNPKTTPVATTATTTTVTNAQLQAMIDQGVTAILAARDANTNGINSHNSGTCNDIAYAMNWTELKKKMNDKYCPRTEIKKLEVEMWELKVKVASKPKTMQEATEMAIKVMDKRIRTFLLTVRQRTRESKITTNNHNNNTKTRGRTPAGLMLQGLSTGHFKRECPKLKSNNNQGNQVRGGNAPAKVYAVGHARTNPNSNVVIGTFLLNNRYDSVLFDTGADRSFVSTAFSSQIDITPTASDHYYDVELADRRIIGLNTILRYQAIIVCAEKIVRIPWGNETLIVHSDGSNQGHKARLHIISYTKTQEYMLKGCLVFLANVNTKDTEDKSKKKRLEEIPIIQDFPDVFPEDLSGLPPTQQVEFQIDLIPGAALVARAPYRLTPSKIKELSKQLKELSDKGFIRPSSSP
ncbi:putative reverse transcriptase domain-containing protein [Tanacetum coccineum]|uniref:Reverse transcriptase domain-containing protein n=1 Tax=Tanacetum coccineum TaxID=301880 RepID=A0ABQ5IUB6_9ASTR